MFFSQEMPRAGWPNGPRPRGLFVTDFDGTLLRSDQTVAKPDRNALVTLGRLGVVRVIATGRSIYSFNTVKIPELPVDYVIFSTGAGINRYPAGKIVRQVSLDPAEVNLATRVLLSAGLDFMVHRPIPENHRFAYHAAAESNPDFENRIRRYRPFAFPLEDTARDFGPATQLLVVLPPADNRPILEALRRQLPDFNVIQTTSPLDHKSTWLEIFPANVSKSLTTEWLAAELSLASENVLALGNDYNDTDLLEWSATSFVVSNAPRELKARFQTVASNDNCGVAEAVERWLAAKNPR